VTVYRFEILPGCLDIRSQVKVLLVHPVLALASAFDPAPSVDCVPTAAPAMCASVAQTPGTDFSLAVAVSGKFDFGQSMMYGVTQIDVPFDFGHIRQLFLELHADSSVDASEAHIAPNYPRRLVALY